MRDGGSSALEVCGTVAQSCTGRRRRAVRCGAGDGGGWSKKKKKLWRCGAGDETLAWSVGGVRDGGSCASEVCGTVGAVRDGGAGRRRR